jgi:predicted nucleic acid-binding protein
MTLPRKTGREDLAYLYKTLITNFPNLTIIPLDTEIADRAAAIRGTYNLKTPDAIQVATGLVSKASLFVTFDKELESVTPLINVYIPKKI